jgi:hypothetical protein
MSLFGANTIGYCYLHSITLEDDVVRYNNEELYLELQLEKFVVCTNGELALVSCKLDLVFGGIFHKINSLLETPIPYDDRIIVTDRKRLSKKIPSSPCRMLIQITGIYRTVAGACFVCTLQEINQVEII